MPNWTDIPIQTAQNAVDSILGIALGGLNDRRQLNQQGRLQRQQIQGQKQIMDYAMQKQYEMWLKTNYSAQREQLELAGLNPGLLYGMSGGGGATVGGGSPSVGGANAPVGGGEVQAIMGMGMQYRLMEAQKKVLESQANLNNVQATKAAGVDTDKARTEIQSLTAGIDNTKQQTEFSKVQTRLAKIDELTRGDINEQTADRIYWEMRKAREEFQVAEQETWLSRETRDQKVAILEAQALEAAIRIEAAKMGIKVQEQQIEQMKAMVKQGAKKLEIEEVASKQVGWDKALVGRIMQNWDDKRK